MKFIEFPSVFVQKEAPDTKTVVRIDSIEMIQINTSGDDKDNTGDYFLWLYLRSGDVKSCFRGTLEECKERYEKLCATCVISSLTYTLA